MSSDPYTLKGIRSSALFGAILIALGCGCQAAFAPTVRVSCPTRTPSSVDCELRWLVAFDTIPVRRTPLPALQSVGEIIPTNPKSRRGSAVTMYLNTASGPVRTIMWGDHLSLQRELRDPLQQYLSGSNAAAIEATMWPSRWVDPGGTADDRLLRKPHPIRLVANVLIGAGLLFWIWLPWQIVRAVARGNRHE